MKRVAMSSAILIFISSVAIAAEQSPDRSHVKIVDVPRQCLEAGSFEKNGMKYTCTKVDSSEVWNEAELQTFNKEIFQAYRQPLPRDPDPATLIGLVVRQDTVYTRVQTESKTVSDEKNEVALVERRDGYKYRYARK